MACVETVCHKQQNITSNTVLNMFLWLVLNHKNFEYTLCRNRATSSKRKCVTKTFKERAAASDRKCATVSGNIFLRNVRLLLKANVRLLLNISFKKKCAAGFF